LLVEDDLDTKNVVETLLQGRAIIVSVETIEAALHKISHEKFDLAILDLLLPDGNGVSLFPALTEHQIPILVFSAIELGEDYLGLVRHALIKTETSNQELLEAINRILDKIE
jgi:DNA-binding response OmpR family regulator